MPKKQKNNKLPPFAHPFKHGRLHWKKVLFIVMIGTFGLVLASAVTAQVFYNKYVYDFLGYNSVFQMRTYVKEAINGLIEIYEVVGEDNRIEKAKLLLPAETDEVNKVVYFYTPEDKGTYEDGTAYSSPEMVQITTRRLAQSGTVALNTTDFDALFSGIPQAQACTRSFILHFKAINDNGLTLSVIKKLQDGRTLYIYREPACMQYGMDELEAYLNLAQSY